MDDRAFPILWPYRRQEVDAWDELGCPKSVPWSFVEVYERQAMRNHSQTLARLAERGGLSPAEMVSLLDGTTWPTMTDVQAIPELLARLDAHSAQSNGWPPECYEPGHGKRCQCFQGS